MRRLDAAAGELNAFLVVVAIGLAVLDLSALWALKVEAMLPPITRIGSAYEPPSPDRTIERHP